MKTKTRMKKIVCVLLTVVSVFTFCITSSFAQNDTSSEIQTIVNSLFETDDNKVLFDEEFLKFAGTTAVDWYVIALNSADIDAEYSKYLDALKVYVKGKYDTTNKLHPAKATEWHRIALAVKACGDNPQDFEGIDLISDGIFQRDLDKQGLSAYIWALICLDSGDYKEPQNAQNDINSIIEKLVSSQLSDGGFTLSGSTGDVDVTAMVVTALSRHNDKENVKLTIEKAVDFLAKAQEQDGGFMSYGIKNCESACQVVIALSSLGIDAKTDERFVKNGSAYENILAYKTEGGYKHLPDGEMNILATQQALLAFIAYNKMSDGFVYNFDEKEPENTKISLTESDKELIKSLSVKVNASDLQTLKRLQQSLESYDGDDKFVLETSVGVSMKKALEIQKSIDYIVNKTDEMSQSRLKFSYKSEIEKLLESYEKLSDSDKILVENFNTLQTLKASLDTKIRQTIIACCLGFVVACGLIYLIVKKLKSKED